MARLKAIAPGTPIDSAMASDRAAPARAAGNRPSKRSTKARLLVIHISAQTWPVARADRSTRSMLDRASS